MIFYYYFLKNKFVTLLLFLHYIILINIKCNFTNSKMIINLLILFKLKYHYSYSFYVNLKWDINQFLKILEK